MSKPINIRKVHGMRERVAYAQQKSKEQHYFKIQSLDGTWMLSTSANLMDVVKMGLTKAEADAYLKLLKEQ
jgi:hypothetical protein